MEPWQQEALLQLQLEHRRKGLPRCGCCDEPITTERYLDLNPFGINARACEACAEANMHETEI